MTKLDFLHINCDMGEGFGHEDKIMPYVSACNLACGGHAGNEKLMTKLINLAKLHEIEIGAHPAYPDRKNFGRIRLSIDGDALTHSIRLQLQTLQRILNEKKATLSHIKAHGALYNDLSVDRALCQTFLHAISPYKNQAVLYAPFRSVLLEMAKNKGWKTKTEAFADRNYNPDYRLVSRSQPNALLSDPKDIAIQLKRMVIQGQLRCADGSMLPIQADTFCFHSDQEKSAEVIQKVIKLLKDENCN